MYAHVIVDIAHSSVDRVFEYRVPEGMELALGQRVTGPGLALEIVDAWLAATFEGGRHQRRVDKLMALEEKEPLPDGDGR